MELEQGRGPRSGAGSLAAEDSALGGGVGDDGLSLKPSQLSLPNSGA